MLRDRMRDLVAKGDEQGDRYWVKDLNGPSVTVGIVETGEDVRWLDGCVGLVDDEHGGMIAYGSPDLMRELADRLNKLDAIEELLS